MATTGLQFGGLNSQKLGIELNLILFISMITQLISIMLITGFGAKPLKFYTILLKFRRVYTESWGPPRGGPGGPCPPPRTDGGGPVMHLPPPPIFWENSVMKQN